MTILRIVYNYVRYAYGKCAILSEEAVQHLGTWYMKADYGTYEYEKEKDMGQEHINLWCRQDDYLLTFELFCMICK